MEYAEKRQLKLPEIKDFQAVFGRGVEGTLAEELPAMPLISEAEDGPVAVFAAGKTEEGKTEVSVNSGRMSSPVKAGTRFLVGNRAYLEENGVEIPKEVLESLEEIAAEGKTPLLVAAEGRLAGSIAVEDTVKSSSYVAIDRLRKMGIHVVMLTGDNRRTAEAVRQELGIEEVVAEVLPQPVEGGRQKGGNDWGRYQRCPGTGSGRCGNGNRRRYGCCHGKRRYCTDEE